MGEKFGGADDAGQCGNLFDVKASPEIADDLVIVGSVNGKSTNSLDCNKVTKLVNDIPGSTSGNLIVTVDGKEYLIIDDLSTLETEIVKEEILNTKIKIYSNKYDEDTINKLRQRYIKNNMGDAISKVHGSRHPVLPVGVAQVKIYGFTWRSIGVMNVEVNIDVLIIDRLGNEKTKKIELIGKLAAADLNRWLSIGYTEFYTMLEGPAIRRIEDVVNAFHGQLLKTCGATVQLGAGVTAGPFSIGEYVSSEAINETTGIGNSFGCLAGKLKLK